MSTNKLYNELLKDYVTKYGEEGRRILEHHIINIMREQFVKRDEAIRILYKKIKEEKITRREVMKIMKVNDVEAYVKYDGASYGVVYLPIDDFESELHKLGKLLDFIENNLGEVVLVVPNIGLTKTSLILGTSFQGVKGFAIIFKKR